MNVEMFKFLFNSGVAVGILCFVFWYMLKPMINAYIKSIQEVAESMKRQTDAMHQAQQVSQEMFTEIINKIHASEEKIINHINALKK